MGNKLTIHTAVLLFALATASCTIKTGEAFFKKNEMDSIKSSSPILSMEVEFLRIGQSSFSFNIMGKKFDIEPDVRLIDADITWRYHFEEGEKFQPYLGGGAGYYKFSSSTTDPCPSGDFCFSGGGFPDRTHVTDIASGYNPHLVAGVRIPIRGKGRSRGKWLVIEDRYEFLKEENGFDFGAHTIFLGMFFLLPRSGDD